MPRLLKIMIPYVVAVLGALAIFVAGAFVAFWFTGRVLTPRLGAQELSELVQDHSVVSYLDVGNVEDARHFLILREDGNLMSLDMLGPYLPDDLARTTCRVMQKVAKQRADNAATYSGIGNSDPEVRQMVAASLQNPAACARAVDKEMPPKRQ